MDWGKWNYEQQKKQAQAKKKQKVMEVKELKFSPNIEEHDYQVKLKKAREFFEDGDKVKFSIRFRGREITNKEAGEKIFNKLIEDLSDIAHMDGKAKLEGRNMLMFLVPGLKK